MIGVLVLAYRCPKVDLEVLMRSRLGNATEYVHDQQEHLSRYRRKPPTGRESGAPSSGKIVS